MQQNVASFEEQAQTRDMRPQSFAQPMYQGTPPNNGWQQSQYPPHEQSQYPPRNQSYYPPQPSSQYPPQTQSQYSSQPQRGYSQSDYSNSNATSAASVYSSAPSSQIPNFGQPPNFNEPSEIPNFSPFPSLRNPGPNIPPTDEQKETVLEAAREAVLACPDPDQQLTWAQDALSYCEVAIQNEARVSRTQTARPRTPRIEHALREDAMKVTNFLADQLHPRAQFMRGMWYEFGKFGYPVDKPESFQCYKRASERGYQRANYRVGMQFESGNDPLTAIKYYKMAADAGDSAACYRLGMMTLLGQHGQMQDYEEGLQLIYAAAQTADDNAPQGAYVLGMLQAGELPQVKVPEHYLQKNVQSAKVNIERAAFLGFAKAQVRMGAAYELGELNCPFDPALSLHYNALAARQGEVDAEMAISKWFLCGHEGVFEKNEELAFTFAQRAAIDGMPTAQFAVGYFYEVGIYVKMDLKEAKEWYRKADENGNKDAKKRIDAVSRSKTISRKEHEKISLQKIRDQHRLSTQPSMPTLSEIPSPTLDMPDPSRLNLHGTPAPQRPTSAAPYPAESTSFQSLPEIRPTSAFGINPNLRPNPVATMPVRPLDQYNMGQVDRPYSVGQRDDGYGRRPGARPGPPPQERLTPQQRPTGRPSSAASGPPSMNPRMSPNPQQQQQQKPLPAPQTNSAPNLNFGFVAPVDEQGADRPNWAPKSSGAGEGPRPPSAHPGGRPDQQPPRASGGLPSQLAGRPGPNQGYQPNPNRPQAQASQPRPPIPQQQNAQQRPYQQQSGQPRPQQYSQQRPQQQQQAAHVQAANMKPTTPNPMAPPDTHAPQSPQQVSASQAAVKPPGKGPKTFAEMGIAQHTEEKDCIVM